MLHTSKFSPSITNYELYVELEINSEHEFNRKRKMNKQTPTFHSQLNALVQFTLKNTNQTPAEPNNEPQKIKRRRFVQYNEQLHPELQR